ncbi:OmpA family protein [Apibacter muscae]|uniref:OmpA family protein n=1 Tax=Apibacter muscae TaxID=2509004 RepID=UPI0011ADBCBD|nr:OmpA family protein [Apibacter muscae]TWP25155.1 OmpA family protein [Apibacter muscae]TWP25156.1 OmpA family protein [Apibacter muscae]
MKKFNLLVTVAASMIASTVFAQNTTDKWYIGIGSHAVDYTSVRGVFDGYFDTKDYSFTFPLSKLTVARSIAKNWAVDMQVSLGEVDNKRMNIQDEFFVLAGLGLRYSPLSESKTMKWLDPYVRVGANYHKYSYDGIKIDENHPYVSYDNDYNPEKEHVLRGKFTGKDNMFVLNGGVGINFWIVKNFGINIESQYNWVTNQSTDYSNFFQHSASLIFKFGAKKPEVIEEVIVISDRDGDGIPDDQDRCPDTPGLAQFQGCPDTDGDGIPDIDDRCPNEAGLAEFQGCPDTDGDGIPDVDDQCPTQYGPKENNGCPYTFEIVTEKLKNINFQFNSAKLTEESLPLVKDAADMLNDRSFEGQKFYVDGYTDRVGSAAVNLRISKQRAQAVLDELVKDGVAKDRLTARGFGKTNYLCTEADINTKRNDQGNILYPDQAACDKANRRVVIISQETGKKPVIEKEVKVKK